MPQSLTISRAAHLLGVSRADLQRQVGDGLLPSHDGMVTTEDLLKLYPALSLEDAGAFENISRIREEAFGRRIRERVLPNQEVLAQRLAAQSEELEDVRRHLAQYHDLIEALRDRIARSAEGAAAAPLADLGRFLEAGLAQVLGSEEPADPLVVMDDLLRVMAARVTVKPSGHEFLVEGNESVLDAALRAGLAPSYGCGNGNCGLCKARVVSGRTQLLNPTDYPLSTAERAQGYTLLCSHTAVSDLVIEMLEAVSPDDIPAQEIVVRVKNVSCLSDDIALLHLQTPRSQRLRFLAGQRATLSVSGSTQNFRGEYPIASCPCDDRNIVFHIRRDDDDEFARRLFAGALRPNDAVSLFGPVGDFVLRKDSIRDLLFVVCDTGFAPVKSLIEHAVAADLPGSLRLLWAATHADGHYLENQCRAWADALENFSYTTLTATAPEAAAMSAAERFLHDEDLHQRDVYVAGPAPFVGAVARVLGEAGMPASQLHCEVL